MLWLIIVVLAVGCGLGWVALTRCTLAGFRPSAGMHSTLRGPRAHARIVAAMVTLPGVRLLERAGDDVLFSVRPVPSSTGRGLGMFVVVRKQRDDVLLLARRRFPLPSGDLGLALRELERDAGRP